jgi:hypothetical protein
LTKLIKYNTIITGFFFGGNMVEKVRFVALSSWQKKDCLSCGADATQQAEKGPCFVRCCDKKECKDYAALQAESMASAMQK